MKRSILWIIAFILLVISLAIFLCLAWGKIPTIKTDTLAFSDLVNLLIAFLTMAGLTIAFVSLYIAIATYQKSVRDNEDQQKNLDASRAQLEAVVSAAIQQQEILSQNLATSKSQLNLLEEQWKRELERQGRKPSVELSLETDNEIIKLGNLQKRPSIELLIGQDQNWFRIQLLVINKGNGAVLRPMVRMEMYPKTVFIDRPDQRVANRVDHSTLQYSGYEILDIEPFDLIRAPSRFVGDVTVPNNIETFDIKFIVSGGNLSRKEHLVHIRVVRQHT